jgi:hypothetical protein
MKTVFVITDIKNDDPKKRKELEIIAMKLHGNLYGLKKNEEYNIIYMFNFSNNKNALKFKEQIKNYETTIEDD